jgi:hypothetical protein
MDEAEADVRAFIASPRACPSRKRDHRPKIHSTNPLERLNGEIKRRIDVVGIFPNEDAITRLVGAIMLEQNDEWAVQRARYITLETTVPLSEAPIFRLPKGSLTTPAKPAGECDSDAALTPRLGTRSDRSGRDADPSLLDQCDQRLRSVGHIDECPRGRDREN